MPWDDTYLGIDEYGAIGNLRTVALVGINGSIDWCCLPEIESPAVFARMLDHERGGCFQVAPVRPLERRQRYLPFTNVLETTFGTEGGQLVVTDFMPLDGRLDDPEGHTTSPTICRLVRAEGGDVEVEIRWIPRFDFGRSDHAVEPTNSGFVAYAQDWKLALGGIPEGAITSETTGRNVFSRLILRAGGSLGLVMTWDEARVEAGPELVERKLEATVRSWEGWARNERQGDDRSWAGYWNEHVVRSELALKLLTFAPTGAIAAAPTTSLPEWIGGVRNWDYRYSWIRDAGLSAQAFNAMGHTAEAGAYVRWAERVAREHLSTDGEMPIMYSVHGVHCLPEEELDHFEGYRGSKPVRIGNKAAEQLQLDIYGELLEAGYEYVRMGGDFEADIWEFLHRVAQVSEGIWRKPDYGIWEVRREPQHFTYSKFMVWVALQRASVMAARGHFSGDVPRWQRAQAAIREEVLSRGFNPELGSFTAVYEGDSLDAANLMLPLREFIEFEDPRAQGTIDRVLERLTTNDLVYRYNMEDGLPPGEGTFILCTFWLVDALALSGRMDEAYRIFDGLAGRVNHVGLLSEQIEPETGAFLGNFPQAFSHIGLINSALYLAHAEGRETPVQAPLGTQEHRAESAALLARLPAGSPQAMSSG